MLGHRNVEHSRTYKIKECSEEREKHSKGPTSGQMVTAGIYNVRACFSPHVDHEL